MPLCGWVTLGRHSMSGTKIACGDGDRTKAHRRLRRSLATRHVPPNSTFKTRQSSVEFNWKKLLSVYELDVKNVNRGKNESFNRVKCLRRRWCRWDSPESFVRVKVPDSCIVVVFQFTDNFVRSVSSYYRWDYRLSIVIMYDFIHSRKTTFSPIVYIAHKNVWFYAKITYNTHV